MSNIVTLAIGSNLGDRIVNIEKSLSFFENSILLKAKLYETKAFLLPNSDPSWDINYVNTVVQISTKMSAFELIKFIKKIELTIGRNPDHQKWSPREIDIDIIFYNNSIIDTLDLTIPHKFCHLRKFVLDPLVEIGPDIIHPILQKTAKEMLLDL